MKQKPDRN